MTLFLCASVAFITESETVAVLLRDTVILKHVHNHLTITEASQIMSGMAEDFLRSEAAVANGDLFDQWQTLSTSDLCATTGIVSADADIAKRQRQGPRHNRVTSFVVRCAAWVSFPVRHPITLAATVSPRMACPGVAPVMKAGAK
jgi:hypothetical protein